MNKYEIRAYIKEHGVQGFSEGVSSLLQGTELPNGVKIRLQPRQFSIREMYEGMVGPLGETPLAVLRESGALDATGFPTLTEKLLSTEAIAGYTSRPGIADVLVPRMVEPRTLTERIPGVTTTEGPKNVLPGEPYPAVGFGDKYVDFEAALMNKKDGFLIQVNEEVIRFDQTGMIMEAANNAGMQLQTERERRTVRAVLGIGSDTGTTIGGVYYPSSVDTPLYLASQNNLRTNATPIYNHPGQTADSKLENYTDIQEALTVQAQNVKDDRLLGTQRPIVWNPDRILVPVSLAATVANIFGALGVTVINPFTAGTNNELRTMTASNPLTGLFAGMVPQPISSVFVDEVSATMWVIYDSQRAFVRVNIFPFQTFRSPAGFKWNEDVLFAVKVREWSRVIAKDFRVSQRSNGA